MNEKICATCLRMVDVSEPDWQERSCEATGYRLPHAPREDPVTLEDVRLLVAQAASMVPAGIDAAIKNDDAHAVEDTVVWAAMRAIAAGAAEPVEIAKAVLALRDRDYARWFS